MSDWFKSSTCCGFVAGDPSFFTSSIFIYIILSAGGAEGTNVDSVLQVPFELLSMVATVEDILAANPIPPDDKSDVARKERGDVVTGTSHWFSVCALLVVGSILVKLSCA